MMRLCVHLGSGLSSSLKAVLFTHYFISSILIPVNMYDPHGSMAIEAAGGSWVLEGPRVCYKDGARTLCSTH